MVKKSKLKGLGPMIGDYLWMPIPLIALFLGGQSIKQQFTTFKLLPLEHAIPLLVLGLIWFIGFGMKFKEDIKSRKEFLRKIGYKL